MGEQEILALIRARDERGMAALLRQYQPLMLYIVKPILADVRDREECVSEIALRVWEKIDSYDPEKGGFAAWLTAFSRNAALNRSRGVKPEAEPLTESMPAHAPSPEETLLRREQQAALLRAVRALSGADRALFYRKYYYLQSTAQIAAELGLTERGVEGRLYRLRLRLRDALGGDDHG